MVIGRQHGRPLAGQLHVQCGVGFTRVEARKPKGLAPATQAADVHARIAPAHRQVPMQLFEERSFRQRIDRRVSRQQRLDNSGTGTRATHDKGTPHGAVS